MAASRSIIPERRRAERTSGSPPVRITSQIRGCDAMYLTAFSIASGERGPEDPIDARRAGRQHDEAVEAERDPARLGHEVQGREEILVQRVALAVNSHLLGHFRLEAAPLLGRVRQLAERVRQLDPAGI